MCLYHLDAHFLILRTQYIPQKASIAKPYSSTQEKYRKRDKPNITLLYHIPKNQVTIISDFLRSI